MNTLMIFTAVVTDPTSEVILKLLQGLGVPGSIIFILGYSARRVFQWGTPWVEKIFTAYVTRQDEMRDNTTKLTEACIEIQSENARVLREVNANLAHVCKGVPRR